MSESKVAPVGSCRRRTTSRSRATKVSSMRPSSRARRLERPL